MRKDKSERCPRRTGKSKGNRLVLVVVTGLAVLRAASQAPGADPLAVTLDASRTGPKLDRHLFGQFAEHLGKGVYEGVGVDPGSPMRPVTLNPNWGGVTEPNTFGTHEFLDFIDQIGAEAYLSVNVGSGTPAEAADWLEYLTAAQPTALAKERAANGRPAPYKIAILGVGNENWTIAAYNYGESKNTVDPGSIAAGSFTGNAINGDPNNPRLAYSNASPGHRFFMAANYRKEYFGFGATSFAVFWETRTINNASYLFSGDLNGDSATGNDLIYIPRNTSEMNFQDITGAVPFTAAQQAAAWEAFIQQDPYLSKHRGEYAERGAVFLPMVKRMDLNISQDVFKTIGGKRQRFQFRADFINFGNLLNKNWGVSQRLVNNTPLIVPTAQGGPVDAQGRAQYRMRVINGQLMSKSFEQTADLNDVYRVMFSFRYFFN